MQPTIENNVVVDFVPDVSHPLHDCKCINLAQICILTFLILKKNESALDLALSLEKHSRNDSCAMGCILLVVLGGKYITSVLFSSERFLFVP